MKKFLIVGLFWGIGLLQAEERDWVVKGMLGVNYNETIVSDNWSGGEKDAKNWALKLEASVEKAWRKTNWLNSLKAEFGKAKIEANSAQENADLIDFDSVYSWKLNNYVNPYLSFTIDTQFTEYFDPVTYGESTGLGWIIIKEKKQNLKIRLGAAFRQKFDPKDNGVSTTDDPSTLEIEEFRNEIGAEWITNYDLLMNKSTKYISEIKVFSAFNGGSSLRWDNSLYLKSGKYLTVQISYLMLYNYDEYVNPVWPDDIESRLTLTIGFSYNLF